ncbi:hypothetical protein GOBAR_DD10514 [Gossypium barbadense]|nr:hypothetical protein GOBAR_DD10514 [Gossypium barbadense]
MGPANWLDRTFSTNKDLLKLLRHWDPTTHVIVGKVKNGKKVEIAQQLWDLSLEKIVGDAIENCRQGWNWERTSDNVGIKFQILQFRPWKNKWEVIEIGEGVKDQEAVIDVGCARNMGTLFDGSIVMLYQQAELDDGWHCYYLEKLNRNYSRTNKYCISIVATVKILSFSSLQIELWTNPCSMFPSRFKELGQVGKLRRNKTC